MDAKLMLDPKGTSASATKSVSSQQTNVKVATSERMENADLLEEIPEIALGNGEKIKCRYLPDSCI